MAGRPYIPPKLNRRVTVRDPDSREAADESRYGDAVGDVTYAAQWEVWASRRDRAASNVVEEAVLVHESQVAFTVRYHADIAALGTVEVVDGEAVYRADGPALERGMRGNSATHLEIHCTRRA